MHPSGNFVSSSTANVWGKMSFSHCNPSLRPPPVPPYPSLYALQGWLLPHYGLPWDLLSVLQCVEIFHISGAGFQTPVDSFKTVFLVVFFSALNQVPTDPRMRPSVAPRHPLCKYPLPSVLGTGESHKRLMHYSMPPMKAHYYRQWRTASLTQRGTQLNESPRTVNECFLPAVHVLKGFGFKGCCLADQGMLLRVPWVHSLGLSSTTYFRAVSFVCVVSLGLLQIWGHSYIWKRAVPVPKNSRKIEIQRADGTLLQRTASIWKRAQRRHILLKVSCAHENVMYMPRMASHACTRVQKVLMCVWC